MPAVTVTNVGTAPLIAADSARTGLLIENNTDFDFRVRFGGPVNLTTPANRGLLLRRQGGGKSLSGTHAQVPVYAIYVGTPQAPLELDYETFTT